MAKLEDYATRYKTIRIERRDGILQMTLHSAGKELQWGALPHGELPQAFQNIAEDKENRIVILTGTGREFSGPKPAPGPRYRRTVNDWDRTTTEGRALLLNMLNIEVPMIAAVNGPAMRHSELPLLCDIVLASDTALFEDSGHFQNGLVPGDGVNIVYPLLLGLNRARYFLLTGQSISAQEAKALGLVNEVLSREKLLPRAWELAEKMNQHPTLHLKHTRMVLTADLRRRLQEHLGYSLSLEAMANLEYPEAPKP
ncbi:MAG TPA: enoyl-CoA hydratase/isomerase family protein [Casimicrobiaceae bacterium]|nr:enoyl-CoA hydratase/isomerase family protein [Casimicrobiaceae bacterium]